MTFSALADLLSAWLPAQRWFAGSGATIRDISITSQVQLAAGDPALVHVIADVSLDAEQVSYQILVGLTRNLPPALEPSRIGTMTDGRIAYDGTADPALAAVLLSGIAERRSTGPLRFAAEPDALIDQRWPARPLPALASNTSIVFGEKAILKLLRRPFEGHHPDLEVPAALARNGSKLVAAPLGWIEMPGASTGEPVILAILSEFFARASDGWSLATDSLRSAEPDFSQQAGQLGRATAELHAELAAAFGTAVLSRPELTRLADTMTAELRRAIAVVPALGEYEARIRAAYARLADPGNRVVVQRIHGDYHLAQVLGTAGGWVVLDFEGEPSVPLARRRAFAPALRDVAGMLRSFDYAARHQALSQPADPRLQATTLGWADRCQEAFCAGYAQVAGADPRRSGPLLPALTLAKAVYEAVYEARHRPHWLSIPLAAIAEASNDSGR